MARTVISGIYRITNKLDGKVYIGQSKDILRRFRLYYWDAASTREVDRRYRPIISAMRKDGIENFEFDIIDQDSKFKDTTQRRIAEMHYIAVYKAADPRYGYNMTSGGEMGTEIPRRQSFHERLKRAMPVFLYNIETQSVLLYWFGARAVANDFKCDKAITSHAVNRCDVFAGKYFIIPARYEDRHRLLERKLISLSEVHSNPKYPNRTETLVANKKTRLLKAFEYIDEIAPEFGYSVQSD